MKSARLLQWMVALNKPVRSCLLVAVLLLLTFGLAQAQEIEGTWKLVMRKLQDGTTQTPPAVQGAATWHNGLRSLIVDGYLPEGKLWSFCGLSAWRKERIRKGQNLVETNPGGPRRVRLLLSG